MIKKLTLALGCLALVVSFTSAARADAITFSFVGGPLVNINSTGLSAGPGVVLLISDTKLNLVFSFLGHCYSFNRSCNFLHRDVDKSQRSVRCRRHGSGNRLRLRWNLPDGQLER